jgi:transcription initiation factor TFIIB
VLSERIIDTRSEWRTFANDEDTSDPSRVGEAAGIEGEELHTEIASDKGTASKDLARAQRNSKAASAARDLSNKQRALRAELRDICGSTHLNDSVTKYAEEIYVMAQKKNFMKGRDQTVIQGACVFIACRKAKVPRTFKEISNIFRIEKVKMLSQMFKRLEHFLKENTKGSAKLSGGGLIEQKKYEGTYAGTAAELIDRFGSRLDLNYPIIAKAKECAKALTLHAGIDAHQPLTIASVALYVVSHIMGDPKNPLQIAMVTNRSRDTIRNVYKLVYPLREKWMRTGWVNEACDIKRLPQAEKE